MPLQQLIIDTIRKQGPLSFRDFMRWRFTIPIRGITPHPATRSGAAGDFYTKSLSYRSLRGNDCRSTGRDVAGSSIAGPSPSSECGAGHRPSLPGYPPLPQTKQGDVRFFTVYHHRKKRMDAAKEKTLLATEGFPAKGPLGRFHPRDPPYPRLHPLK